MSAERVREVRGTAMPVRGEDIDTDRIIPARFLKSVSFDGLENHLFEDDRQQLDAAGGAIHPASNPAYRAAAILLVGVNFGCGSSREHAPQAIRRRGIRAVIGQSFSEIFFGNAVVHGMPCPTVSTESLNALMTAVEANPTTQLVVSTQFLRDHPDQVDALREGLVASVDLIAADPKASHEMTNEAIADVVGKPLTATVLAAGFKNLTFDVDPHPASLLQSARHAHAVGLLDSVDVSGILDLSILNRVLHRLGRPEVSAS